MANIWDDQEPFRDSPVEFKAGGWQEAETFTPAPDNTLRRPMANLASPRQEVEQAIDEDYLEELGEQSAQDEEDDYTEVLSDARLRLEQGKLYEMIMNHNLFDDVEADPRAAKSVQKQIRNWARNQMEIMLGMRQEETAQNNGIGQFNDLEVIVLKKMASTFSKGATESEEANVSQEVVQTVAPKKKTTLNSIGSSRPKQQVQAKPIQKKAEPIKRPQKPKQEVNSQGQLTGKALDEMTDLEKQEKIRQSLENQKGKVAAMPKDRLPMADYATQELLASQQVNRAVGNPGKGNLSAMIMANLKNAGKV